MVPDERPYTARKKSTTLKIATTFLIRNGKFEHDFGASLLPDVLRSFDPATRVHDTVHSKERNRILVKARLPRNDAPLASRSHWTVS